MSSKLIETNLYQDVYVVTCASPDSTMPYGSWVWNKKKDSQMHLVWYRDWGSAIALHKIAVRFAMTCVPDEKQYLLPPDEILSDQPLSDT